MNLFTHPNFDNHHLVAFRHDRLTNLKAIIAVHNNNLGPGSGGCRMLPYQSDADALTDVLQLSRSMTYKSALAGIPLGGGKSVIIGDPNHIKNTELMLAMGDFIESLNGQYICAEDSGTSVDDMKIMAQKTQHVCGWVEGEEHTGDPSPVTAFGLFIGIKTAIKYKLNKPLSETSIAIQGVGKVGYHLARLLVEQGANVIAADINPHNIKYAVETLNVTPCSIDNIISTKADVFSPCALGGSINQKTIHEITAPIIAGGANNQLAEAELDMLLWQKDILYVPDYVINAGGIIDIYYQTQSIREPNIIQRHVSSIGDTVNRILQQAETLDIPTGQVANQLAEARFLSN